jgi:hypothetical protein
LRPSVAIAQTFIHVLGCILAVASVIETNIEARRWPGLR